MAVASPRTNAHGADRVLPLGIALLAVVQLLIAVLIVLAPHWFFNNIGTFGAYNSHYSATPPRSRPGPAPPWRPRSSCHPFVPAPLRPHWRRPNSTRSTNRST